MVALTSMLIRRLYRYSYIIRSLFRSESVARPGLRENKRLTAFDFQLGPQPPHVDPDVLGLGLVAQAPHPAQQVGMGQQLAPVGGQLPEQGELGRREVHRLA